MSSVNDDTHRLNKALQSPLRRRHSMFSRFLIVEKLPPDLIFISSSHSYSNCHHLWVNSTLASKRVLSVLGLNSPEATVHFSSPTNWLKVQVCRALYVNSYATHSVASLQYKKHRNCRQFKQKISVYQQQLLLNIELLWNSNILSNGLSSSNSL